MLKQLSIRNFVLIDRLDVEFEPGMTALTGETGAGKSIVLDALGLALGARADSGAVRAGEKQADITAEFLLEANPQARDWLAAQSELETGTLILRRVIDSAGKSRAQINGRPASVSELRELGAHLLELHAQHEHQALLRNQAQREWLDQFAGAQVDLQAVRESHHQLQKARAALDYAQREADSIAQQRSVLEQELAELREARPDATEWDELTQTQSRLSHARELLETAEQTRAQLADDGGASEQVAGLVSALSGAEKIDSSFAEARALLESAQVQLDEAAQWLRHYAQKLNLDPEQLQQAESRLSSLFALARKLRVRPEQLALHWQVTEDKLVKLTASENVSALEKAVETAEATLRKHAQTLTQRRQGAAEKLSTLATAELPDLALTQAEFKVTLTPLDEIEASGAERVDFMFRSHPSLPLAPLAKVASGGELARLSLAILVVCGDAAAVPTLVFDEVDVGVGGKVAAQVGRKLQALAESRQVFCVTHMPQVAAHADQHYTVSRDNSMTPTTRITPLDRKSRLDEVARMLAGHEVDAATTKLAKALLESSRRTA